MPGRLTETDRRLLTLLREGLFDAEIAVRMGAPIGVVKGRIERLVTTLGVASRDELRALDPGDDRFADDSPGRPADGPPRAVPPGSAAPRRAGVERQAGEMPVPPPPARGVSRPALLGGALAGAATLAAAGVTVLAGGMGGTTRPAARRTPSALPTTRPVSSLRGAVPVAATRYVGPAADVFESRRWDPGEEIDWTGGIFFMDTASGSVTGHRPHSIAGAGTPGPIAWAARGGATVIGAPADAELFVLHRDTDAAERWVFPAERRVVMVAEDYVIAEDRTAPVVGSPYVQQFETYRRDGDVAARFSLPGFGSEWIAAPSGGRAAAWSANGTIYLVDLETGDLVNQVVPPQGFRAESALTTTSGLAHLVFAARDGSRVVRVLDPATLAFNEYPATGHVSRSPGGETAAVQFDLVAPAGDGIRWPGTAVGAVRLGSVSLRTEDGFPPDRWLADGSGFFAARLAVGDDGEGSVEFVLVAADGRSGRRLPAPPKARTLGTIRAPVPAPWSPSLVAFGGTDLLDLATMRWRQAATGRRPVPMNPWSGRQGEMVFALGTRRAPALPAPVAFEALLAPTVLAGGAEGLVVAGPAGQCVDMRSSPDPGGAPLACPGAGTALVRAGTRETGAYALGAGRWVRVRTAQGDEGWLPALSVSGPGTPFSVADA